MKSNTLPLHGDAGRPAAEVTLSGDNLVVVGGAQVEAGILPGVEVSANVDRSAGSLLLANGPELLEGLSTVDGRLVDTGALEDVVVAAVDVDGALAGGAGRGVVGTEVLDDVVFDERVAGPSVDREVRVAVEVVLAGVVDGAEG